MSGISERNPFVGPRPIQYGEPLHGRATEVREIYNRLKARRIVVLHSPSGAGKSSLVQAGLIPKLKAGKFDVWKPIRLNLDPSQQAGIPTTVNRYLLSAMVSLEEELPADRRRSPAQLAELDFLTYLESRPRRKTTEERSVVLIFDQCEELLTIAPHAVDEKRDFVAAIGKALTSEKYWALFIIREDYLAAFAPYRERIPTQMSNTVRLDLLNLDGARETAEKLALEGGRTFPAVDTLIRNLSAIQVQQPDGSFMVEQGQYVEPVHLQVVCRRLWTSMADRDLAITEDDLARHADVAAALAGYYADAVARIADGNVLVERVIREWIGNKLIVGGIRSQVRQEVGRTAGLDNAYIQPLLNCYLVRTEQRVGTSWFELSHDLLVAAVQTDNMAWEAAHLHPLQVQAKLWEDSKRSDAQLASAKQFAGAAAWLRTHSTLLTSSEHDFLNRSRKERLRQRLIRLGTWALVVIGVVVSVVMGVAKHTAESAQAEAEQLRREAEQARAEATEGRKQAHIAARMANAQVLLRNGQVGAAALVAHEVEKPMTVNGWARLVADILLAEMPTSTLRHDVEVKSAAWSPGGNSIVTASGDKVARVWPADGKGDPVRFHGHTQNLTFAGWSPDGKRIVTTSSDRTARVWSMDGSGTSVVLAGHTAVVVNAQWSPDGKRIVTASADKTARIWNADGSGDAIVLDGHRERVILAAWSPDGKRVLTISSDDTARIWHAHEGGSSVAFVGHTQEIVDAAWSPDGERIVTASLDGTARIWDTTSTGVRVLAGHENSVFSVRWSPDGESIVTGSSDSTARIWSAKTGETVRILSGHTGRLFAARWSPDGNRIVTVAADQTARIWDVVHAIKPIILTDHTSTVVSAEWDAAGDRIVTASSDETARVWQMNRSWTPETGDPAHLAGHTGWVLSAAWSPDGARIITGSIDKTARIWDITDGSAIVLAGHKGPVNSVGWSPDSKRVVTAFEEASIWIWSVTGGDPVVLESVGDEVWGAVAWSPDGTRILTSSAGSTASIYTIDGSAAPVTLVGHQDRINSVAWSPDGMRVATGSRDETVCIWNADGTGQPMILRGHERAVVSIAWSPDGTRIATAATNGARIWSVDSGQPTVFQGHINGQVRSVAWSPDSTRILTAGGDKTARVWTLVGAADPIVLPHHDELFSAAWSPDGKYIVTASGAPLAHVWPFEPDSRTYWLAFQRALDRNTDCLDPEQRQALLSESKDAAIEAYEACERRHGRTPGWFN